MHRRRAARRRRGIGEAAHTARRPLGADAAQPALPDDTELREQIENAIDLRRREDFDRFLDARDPGELIEHATLTEVDFKHRKLANDTLFVVGDELFGLLFRPENGWGGGGPERAAADYQPRPRRVHAGAAGGPDAFGCFSCHSKGGPDGAGMQTQNAFLRGDGERLSTAEERNPPHLLGLGPVAVLAREMSDALASPAPQGEIAAPVFLTRSLWGLADTAPYLHDGRAPTLHEAILHHGGEAGEARDAYRALAEADRGALRVFLTTLSREPKLFIP